MQDRFAEIDKNKESKAEKSMGFTDNVGPR
jgi:hypothetical protein